LNDWKLQVQKKMQDFYSKNKQPPAKSSKEYSNNEEFLDQFSNWQLPSGEFPILKNIEKKEKLGQGSFGVVYKGIWQDKVFAMKQLGKDQIEAFGKEAKSLMALNHPNVVRFWGIFGENSNAFYLCVEFVNGGSLEDYLKNLFKNKKKLTETEMLKLATSGAKGMKYLESKTIVHRDLAARNFLIEIKNSAEFSLKVSDFGMSRTLGDHAKSCYYRVGDTNRDILAFKWAAIELLEAPAGNRHYTHKSDVWSFGITLWELANYAQKEPWEELDWKGIISHVKNGRRLSSQSISPTFYAIMESCWLLDPNQRPSFAELYKRLKQTLHPTALQDSAQFPKLTPQSPKQSTPTGSNYENQQSTTGSNYENQQSPRQKRPIDPSWTVDNVCDWMKQLNLTKDYSSLIQSNGIDGEALLQMKSKDEWRELGVTAFGDLLKLTSAVSQK
jgi:serine/threonine protein kinase